MREIQLSPDDTRQTTIRLPVELWRRLRQAAVDRDITQQEVMIQALHRELDRAQKQSGSTKEKEI